MLFHRVIYPLYDSSWETFSCYQDAVEKQLRFERDSLLKENKKVQKCSNVLQNQVTTLSVQLQKACSSGYKPTRGPSKKDHGVMIHDIGDYFLILIRTMSMHSSR